MQQQAKLQPRSLRPRIRLISRGNFCSRGKYSKLFLVDSVSLHGRMYSIHVMSIIMSRSTFSQEKLGKLETTLYFYSSVLLNTSNFSPIPTCQSCYRTCQSEATEVVTLSSRYKSGARSCLHRLQSLDPLLGHFLQQQHERQTSYCRCEVYWILCRRRHHQFGARIVALKT